MGVLSLKNPFHDAEVRPHQRAVLRALLWFTCSAVLLFAVMHLYIGDTWLAVAELCLVGYAALLLHVLQEMDRLRTGSLLFIVPFFVVMMYALASPKNGLTVFVWVLLVPLLSHLLLGRWQGMLVAMVFMMCAGVIFVFKFEMTPGMPGLIEVVHISLCAIAIFGFSYVYEVSRERTEEELRRLALVDPLTGLPNRTRFRDVFARERQRYLRHKTPLSLLVVDVDHFKRVNDTLGHDAGDMALRFVADILSGRIRKTDIAGRLGGEEFGILLSGADIDYARPVAVMLRDRVQLRPFRYHGQDIALSVSIGIAELGRDGLDFRSVFAHADRRLYEAKASGRNRVVG